MGIEYAICFLLDRYPDKARQARDRPELRGWFIGKIMALTNGRFKRYDVADVVTRMIRDVK